jgi:nucleoid-associated protein YgaU
MTSSLKIGIAGLAVVGVGLGAYLVNSGLKGDKAEKASESVKLASSESEQAPAVLATEEPKPAPSMEQISVPSIQETPVASTDNHTGQAGSPAPLGVRESRQDTERTWRPRPLETSEAQPVIPAPPVLPAAVDAADPAGSSEPAPSADQAPISPAPVSTLSDTERMSLQEPSTATQPAKADLAAKTASAASEKMTIHVVQPGDTFSALAVKYLGSHKHVKLIEKANPKINPNRLYVGTKLKIPAAPEASKTVAVSVANDSAAAGEPKAKPVKAPPVDPAKAYTVKPGDSWSSLSTRFLGDPNWTVLYEYNKERFPPNVRTLQPGMVIEIPTKGELERH